MANHGWDHSLFPTDDGGLEKMTPPGSRKRPVQLNFSSEDFGDFVLNVRASESFISIKQKVHDMTGIAPSRQHLLMTRAMPDDPSALLADYSWYHDSRHDGKTLSDYNIEHYLDIELTHRLQY